MKRRHFIRAAALTGPMAGLHTLSAGQQFPQVEFYELRKYLLKNSTQQKLVEAYFLRAFMPAAEKAGLGPVGLFHEYLPQAQTALYALIVYPSLSNMEAFDKKLAADMLYQKAAAPYLKAPHDQPSYERMETSLMKSFTGFPKVKAPAQKPRLFELRRYESSGEANGKLKVQMFNEGEFPIFIRSGLEPVFFGEVLIGPNRPNLTYMIVFDNMKAHDDAWARFGKDPAWKTLSARPEYQNTVSAVIRTFLLPVAGSQL